MSGIPTYATWGLRIFKMSDDYATPGRRKTKGDKKAKGRYNKYKKGGSLRTKTKQFEKKDK